MTEYTSNSEAVREYLTWRERTAQWVGVHSRSGGSETAYVSPSYPPSLLSDPDAPSYGPSDSDDEGSSHSIPPRMMLRYTDGRPDVPISYLDNFSDRPLPRPRNVDGPGALPSTHRRSKSGSHLQTSPNNHDQPRYAQTLSYATSHHTAIPIPVPPPHEYPAPPRSPESIVVLPSRDSDETPQVQVPVNVPSQHSHHSQQFQYSHHSHHSHDSRAHARSPSAFAPPPPLLSSDGIPMMPRNPSFVPRAPSQQHIVAPSPRHAFDPAQFSQGRTHSPPITHSQSQPLPQGHDRTRFVDPRFSGGAQSQLPYTYSPPAIVYAPSSKHSKSRYTPPAIVYSPSATHHNQRRGPPSIKFSQSAPVPLHSHHSVRSGSGPRSFQQGETPVIYEEPVERSRSVGRAPSNGRGRTPVHDFLEVDRSASSRSRSPSPLSGSDGDSRASGSTYYILPTPGQKVKLIVPNSASIYTATSTTKSAHSPQSKYSGSGNGGPRKPFFQRIFNIPKLAGSVDSSGSSQGKRLQRRHTIGGAHLQPRLPVGAVRR
ncbi:hypothetical protein BKA93DRAFT_791791 [Sparassis latifolia]